MKLRALLADLPSPPETRGNLDTEINSLTNNSRETVDRGVFFCVVGLRFDAHAYAAQAVSNGCVALVVERFLEELDVPQIRVDNCRRAMAWMAGTFYGWPSRQMKLIGLTGTKGKTTTSYLIKAIFDSAGYCTGLIGTTGNLIADRHIKSNLTTPDPIELHATLREMADAGVQVVCMEVSAHAIDMHRLEGLRFEAGCYTNLSHDHLDYFETMERYFATKKRFFTDGYIQNAALNADEETAEEIRRDLQVPAVTYGICMNADLFARNIEIREDGVSFEVQLRGLDCFPVRLHLTGTFNVYNALAAASCAMILGISTENIVNGLESLRSVPGRVEMLDTHTPYRVILDYSHSPDALENILRTVREFTRGRVIAVFGCGGDRDQAKRPVMGEIGGQLADLCILTSDNPRTEDPMKILAAIERGIKPTGKPYEVIESRREAIRRALTIARDGDTIILAGKGHETYQEVMGVKRPFDEKAVVAELLQELQAQAGH